MTAQEIRAITVPQKGKLTKIPTGIPSLDPIIRGGVPSGSLVLLIGDAGAGNTDFAYTSAGMLSSHRNDPAMYNPVKMQLENLLTKEESLKLPESICYISFSRSKEDVLRELELAFPQAYAKAWNNKNFFFKDLSSFCSMSPTWDVEKDWSSIKGLRSEGRSQLLRELILTLESQATGSLVIIDSLTKLIRTCSLDWNEFIFFLEDIQRKSKKWDGLVFLLLGKGIIDGNKVEEIMDIVDGVLEFEWTQEGFSRQQTMYIKKFRGLMPGLARENIVRFDTTVTNTDGFSVINVKRISGRR